MSDVRAREVHRAHVKEMLERVHGGRPQSEHLGDSAGPRAEVAVVPQVLGGEGLLLDGICLRKVYLVTPVDLRVL